MVFFTASPFPVRSLSVRALFIFFGFVSVLCGAGLLLSRSYPGQPAPLAQVPVPAKNQANSQPVYPSELPQQPR